MYGILLMEPKFGLGNILGFLGYGKRSTSTWILRDDTFWWV
uniref:Uncharacterized protein n=1 Tax=Nelumbo nucifera TaxID=4432 RepID=A0A822YS74_NELNU|nr:TPA_asm: hypothetical protein HUJ06_004909 [Nelumbo nucifera]